MKKLVLIAILLSVYFITMAESSMTVVFEDDFNRTTLSPGGVPEVEYGISVIGDPSTPSVSGNQLRIPNCKGTGKIGTTFLNAPIATFASPFNPIIDQIQADSIVWTLNFRQNYTSIGTGGFGGMESNQRGLAVVLLSDSNDYSKGNGYAIVAGGDGVRRYRLCSFSNGITTNDNIATIIAGVPTPTAAPYLSFRVVYIPASNTWRYYERIESGSVFTDPLLWDGYYFCGQQEDDTHTSVAMRSFGYINNSYGNIDMIVFTDNFSVRAFSTPTSVDQKQLSSNVYTQNGKIYFTSSYHSQLQLYSINGILIHEVRGVQDISFDVPAGVYTIRIVNESESIIKNVLL